MPSTVNIKSHDIRGVIVAERLDVGDSWHHKPSEPQWPVRVSVVFAEVS